MAERHRDEDSVDATGPMAPGGPAVGMPRWVKVSLIVAIVLALAFIITTLAGIRHGPSIHTPPGSSGSNRSPAEVEPR